MKKLDRIDVVKLVGNPRATLQSWLKYRSVVLAAMQQHPRPYIYTPVNMAASSVCSKMRDAIRGKIAFQYPDSAIDNIILAKWYSEVIFKHDKENVYIGIPEEVNEVLVGVTPTSASNLVFPTLSFEEVSAFVLLLSGSRIKGPVEVRQPPNLELLQRRPNVEVLSKKDGTLVLI